MQASLAELFRRANRDSTALLDFDGRAVTYGELSSVAERNVAALNERGIGRGDRVAIITVNGPQAAVAFLSTACGAGAAPLNPEYGERELEFFLTDLGARAVVVEKDMATLAIAVAEKLSIDILRLDPKTFEISGGRFGRTELAGEAGADEVALLLHTSGTTARPKLVPLTHRNLRASAGNIAATLALTPQDRCLNVMPLFHIHGLAGAVLSSLSAGASVICAPGLRPANFFDWLEAADPTWYTAVPTMHQAILGRSRPVRHRLRFIRSSSASLPPQVMESLERTFGVPVIESYGMTEASHQMASNPLPPAIRKPGSVGRPAGPEITITDGEVCIRGVNVTTGYESNPAANLASFTKGWFRTGDQGYFDADGYLVLTGRIKELINRGGEKIAPREIDEVLLEHTGIQQAVAFAVPHYRLGEDIGVAVVPRDGSPITERDVIKFAASRLSHFKVPSVVRIVSEVPKGPTGKIQRIGLASALGIEPIVESRPAISGAGDAPRTHMESSLQAMWSNVLRVPRPGIHDDFFALGGDSLMAAQIDALVSAEMGLDLPLIVFRTEPTIAGMAAVLESLAASKTSGVADGLVAVRVEGAAAALFCISGHDGGMLRFSNLAHHLPAGFDVFTFRTSNGAGIESIETLAARYIECMRAQQPHGPYLLLGHCFGGFVGYEMASQLRDGGQDVGLLAMVECFQQQWFTKLSAWGRRRVELVHFCRRLRFHWSEAWRARSLAGYLKKRAQAVEKSFAENAQQAEYEACVLEGREFAAGQPMANRAASKRYVPQPYAGRVLLIGPADPRALRYPAPMMGWREFLSGQVRYAEVSDNLLGLMAEPAVAKLADQVSMEVRR